MQNQIRTFCHISFHELRRLASISLYTSARLVTTFWTSCLDYCNSVFASLPEEQRRQLHRVQNTVAQLVLKKRKRGHIALVSALWTALAACEILLQIQDGNFSIPSLQQYTLTLPFIFALHISTSHTLVVISSNKNL